MCNDNQKQNIMLDTYNDHNPENPINQNDLPLSVENVLDNLSDTDREIIQDELNKNDYKLEEARRINRLQKERLDEISKLYTKIYDLESAQFSLTSDMEIELITFKSQFTTLLGLQ